MVLAVGSGVEDDLKYVSRDYGVKATGFVVRISGFLAKGFRVQGF
jgi:hypothetical protein